LGDALFGQEPLSDGRYIFFLLFAPLAVAVLVLGVIVGMSRLSLLIQAMVAVGAVVTVYRERQRRIRKRTARLKRC
jgi:hypothetical protein